MASGPPELHEKWNNCGEDGCSDWNAIRFLQRRGYTLKRNWSWTAPTPYHHIDGEEHSAIIYLFMEWDFGRVDVY